MNESVAEALILAINALGAGILLFIAGVLQKLMNDMDEPDFKRFLTALGRTAMSNHLAVTVATLPIIAVVLMACQFGVREVDIVVVLSAVISLPLTWLARKYIPNYPRPPARQRA